MLLGAFFLCVQDKLSIVVAELDEEYVISDHLYNTNTVVFVLV